MPNDLHIADSTNNLLPPNLYASKENATKKEKAQANKINSIISVMNDNFIAKTNQEEITVNSSYKLSKERSLYIDRNRDLCYNEFANVSFDLYTPSVKKGQIIPLLKVECSGMIGDIIFAGFNDYNTPTEALAAYAQFIFTKNEQANENQISLYAYKDIPSYKWHCSLQFIVDGVNEDIEVVEMEKSSNE